MHYLVNQDTNHNKFYIIEQPVQHQVVITYGRLGTSGRKTVSNHNSGYLADRFASNKWHSKRDRGYEEVSEKEFKKLQLQAAIVGSANKCTRIDWVEQSGGGLWRLTESDLLNPDCNACLLVDVETRKKYDGMQNFTILFTQDQSYLCSGGMKRVKTSVITENSDLYKFVNKIGEAALLQNESVDE